MAEFLPVRVSVRHVATADNGDRTIILTTRVGDDVPPINIATLNHEAWDALSSAAPDDEDMEY